MVFCLYRNYCVNSFAGMKIIYIGTYNNLILNTLLNCQEVVGIAQSVHSHEYPLLNHIVFYLNDFHRTIKGESCLQLSTTARNNKIPFFSFTKEEQSDLAQWIK